MEANVPTQYLINSYFNASISAFNPWISWHTQICNVRIWSLKKKCKSWEVLTRSILLLRLMVSWWWWLSSSRILLIKKRTNKSNWVYNYMQKKLKKSLCNVICRRYIPFLEIKIQTQACSDFVDFVPDEFGPVNVRHSEKQHLREEVLP